jgi:hypothetical protein
MNFSVGACFNRADLGIEQRPDWCRNLSSAPVFSDSFALSFCYWLPIVLDLINQMRIVCA